MTPVSRRKLSEKAEKQVLAIFTSELSKITDKEKLDSFLSLLLSESERLMLAKRLVAYVLIDDKMPDTEIARKLHLTTVTVAKLRFAYLLSKERKEPVAEIVQMPSLKQIVFALVDELLFAPSHRLFHRKRKRS